MKKYLSKTYLVGVIALTLAFGLQSFQKAQVNKKAETTQTMVWFPASSQNQTNCEETNSFDLDNGTTVKPDGCEETHSYCCAQGYPISDCDEIAPGVYQLKASPLNPGLVIRYNP
ncbi:MULTISPECIES: hypothetical protein [Sphingobacterium]|uniref:hypothetical protein n=1 Tax=Sphingobacterium TaxID=28453 RepID=UPI0013D9944F|nr:MULTISPECIES: hypothetical protein [unclassified Sphingobacterium]